MGNPKRRRQPAAETSRGAATARRRGRTAESGSNKPQDTPWLLTAALALLVAEPFIPGVAVAQQGHGAIFVILWLVMLSAWLAARMKSRDGGLRFSATDAAVLLFFALYAVSGVVAAVRASPRPALNVTWHWLSVGVAFFLFRQLVQGPIARRAVAAVLIALATGMAALGLEQVLISLPATRTLYTRYKDDPQELYRQTGHWLPEGSVLREQFEARLKSAEPTATFALSNSLAGLLIPAIVLATGILAVQFRPAADGRARTPWLFLSVLVLVGCLVLTHSRSGIAATAALAAASVVLLSKRRAVWSTVLVLGTAVIVGAAYLARPDSFADALRSLAYRLEYWQSTWAMIRDFPLFGCGPGQFQDTYTAYKLPAASEEVADPHNFLLEVAATGGLLAALLFIAAVSLAVWHLLRTTGRGVEPDEPDTKSQYSPQTFDLRARHAYLGAAAGTLLGLAAAWLDGIPLPAGHTFLFAAAAAVTLGILHRWVRAGRMPRFLPGAAAGGLLLHLTVSGGIGEPPLAIVLFVLMALQLDAAAPGGSVAAAASSRLRKHLTGPRTAAGGLIVALGLLVAAYVTYYRPVLRASAELTRADAAALTGRDAEHAQAVRAAVEADRWSIEAARRAVALHFSAWEAAPTAEALAAWRSADERSRRLAPRRHWVWRASAERSLALYEVNGSNRALQRGLAHARRAVELYPNHADHHLFRAELLARAGRREEARRAIATAERLDRAQEAAGHTDKTLPPHRRDVLESLAERLSAAP